MNDEPVLMFILHPFIVHRFLPITPDRFHRAVVQRVL